MVFSSHPVGSEVEVRSSEEGFRGAWFEATVVQGRAKYRRYTVAYAALLSDDVPPKPLEDTVYFTFVRPRPPPRSDPGAPFELHQLVEAFHNDGWWKGVVSEVPEQKGGLYRVCFPSSREELEFKGEELREQLEWVKGKWVAVQNQQVEEEDLTFVVGSRIEVSRDKENFGAAWYVGTVLKVIGKNNFLVEYETVKLDDGGGNGDSLKEIVDLQYIRPSPPPASNFDSIFDVLEEVEAFHKCGWVAGVVSELCGGLRYVVKSKHHEEEIEVDKTAIRPRFHWTNKHWVRISRDKSGTRSYRRRRKSLVAKRSYRRRSLVANESTFLVSAPFFSDNGGGFAGTSGAASLKSRESEHHRVDRGVEASQPSSELNKYKFLEEHLKLVDGTMSVGRTSKRSSRSGKRSSLSIALFSHYNNVEVVESFTSLKDKVVEGANFKARVNSSQPSKKPEKRKSPEEHLQLVDSTLINCGSKTSLMGEKNSSVGLLSEGSPALVTGQQISNRPSHQQVGKKSLLLSFPLSLEPCQEQGISRVTETDSRNSVKGSSGYMRGLSEQQSKAANFGHPLVEPANSIPLTDSRDRKPARGSRGNTKSRRKKPIIRARYRKRKLCDVIDAGQHAQEERKERKRGRPSKKQVAYMNGIESEQWDGRINIAVGDKERMEFVEPSNQTPTIDVSDNAKSVCFDKVKVEKTSVPTVNIERKTPNIDVFKICLGNMQADIMEDSHEIPKIESYIPVAKSLKYSTIQQLPVLEPFDHRVAEIEIEAEAQNQARPSMEDDIHIYDKLIQTEIESGVEMGRSPIDHMPNGLTLIKEYNVCDQDELTESGSPRENATVGIEDMAPLDHIPSTSSLSREDHAPDHDESTRGEPLLDKDVFAMERAPSDPTPSGSSPSEEDIRGHDKLIPSAMPLEKDTVEADGRDEVDSSPGRSFCNKVGLPFIKESAMWEIVESMEALHRMPQQPHFHPLEQYEIEFREGMAIGLMVTFANLVDSIQKLRLTDSQYIFQEKMKALIPLELNGFKVHSVRSRLEKLLDIRINASQSNGKKLSLKEKIVERVDERDQFDALVAAHDKIIMELEENLYRYRVKRASMLSGRDKQDSEIVRLKKDLQATEQVYNSANEHFNAVIDAPWEMEDDYVQAGHHRWRLP